MFSDITRHSYERGTSVALSLVMLSHRVGRQRCRLVGARLIGICRALRQSLNARRGSLPAMMGRSALVAALVLLGAASQAWAAVSFQSTATANGTNVTTVTSAAFNPGVGSNRLLVVGLSFGQGVPGSVAVTYGGVTLFL